MSSIELSLSLKLIIDDIKKELPSPANKISLTIIPHVPHPLSTINNRILKVLTLPECQLLYPSSISFVDKIYKLLEILDIFPQKNLTYYNLLSKLVAKEEDLLFSAIENGNISLIENFVSKKKNKNKITIEHINHAIKFKQLDFLKKLLKVIKKNGNWRDSSKNSPWHWAILCNDKAICEELIQSGVPINYLTFNRNEKGDTPFHLCVSYGTQEILDLLLKEYTKKGKDQLKFFINLTNGGGYTPYLLAVSLGELDKAKLLIENGSSRLFNVKNLNTDIHFAVEADNLPLVEYVYSLDHRSFVKKNNKLQTAAFFIKSAKVLEYFLKQDSNGLLSVDENGHMAIWSIFSHAKDPIECFDLVMKGRPSLEAHLFKSESILFIAAQNGSVEFFKYLKDKFHLNPKEIIENGTTMLHIAAAEDHVGLYEYLIEKEKLDKDKARIFQHTSTELGWEDTVTELETPFSIICRPREGKPSQILTHELNCFNKKFDEWKQRWNEEGKDIHQSIFSYFDLINSLNGFLRNMTKNHEKAGNGITIYSEKYAELTSKLTILLQLFKDPLLLSKINENLIRLEVEKEQVENLAFAKVYLNGLNECKNLLTQAYIQSEQLIEKLQPLLESAERLVGLYSKLSKDMNKKTFEQIKQLFNEKELLLAIAEATQATKADDYKKYLKLSEERFQQIYGYGLELGADLRMIGVDIDLKGFKEEILNKNSNSLEKWNEFIQLFEKKLNFLSDLKQITAIKGSIDVLEKLWKEMDRKKVDEGLLKEILDQEITLNRTLLTCFFKSDTFAKKIANETKQRNVDYLTLSQLGTSFSPFDFYNPNFTFGKKK
ncbi:MAG: ankyrin repeat domain-containing protein [Chlamydiae bacterium]|nr:ankyrin repeat domain-containing protein [Chlamydiota bacterium]